MAKQVFLVGIGGTGMRCIESFIHLCAIGMFDETEVNLLALDTDKENGNYRRLRELKDYYLKSKGLNTRSHVSHKETFFSAKLNYYQYSPDYSNKSSFEAIYNYDDIKDKKAEQADIADLVLTKNTRTFDLKHGYRAQTHLGSMLMYHSIIEEVKNNDQSDIYKYVSKLIEASDGGNPRVFILGSVFGGTGASSISVIPKALSKAAALISTATDLEKNAYFGSILLTGYFSFKLPSDNEKAMQKVIATSDKFSFNSQAAMMYYEADDTIKTIYQKLYMLGTQNLSWSTDVEDKKTKTGGKDQENDSHYVELMAAFAAHNFFNVQDDDLEYNKSNLKLDYLYRTIDENGVLRFSDFANENYEKEFAKKFGLFIAMAFLVAIDKYDCMMQAYNGGFDNKQIKLDYDTIEKDEINSLKSYFELFCLKKDKSGNTNGWLQQLHRSAGGANKFLFTPELFNNRNLSNFKFNKKLYKSDSDFDKHSFSAGLMKNAIYDTFKTAFLKTDNPTQMSEPTERFIKHSYDTLVKLYKF
jgi:hypothetical protein